MVSGVRRTKLNAKRTYPLTRRNIVNSYLVGGGVIGVEKVDDRAQLLLPYDDTSVWRAFVSGIRVGNQFDSRRLLSEMEGENTHPMLIRTMERELDYAHVIVRLVDMLPLLVQQSERRA